MIGLFKKKALVELTTLGGLIAGTYLLVLFLDLDPLEDLYLWSRRHASWQLDELTFLSVVFVFALGIIGYWRLVETRLKLAARRQAEEGLIHQAQIVAQVHDAIVTTDLENRITSWNRGAERLYGYKQEEVLGRPADFIFPEESRVMLGDIARRELAEKDEFSLEVPMLKKTGERFYAHLSLSVMRGQGGEPAGRIGCALNITERKRTEEALRRSEQRLIEAQRIAKMGDFTWEMETGRVTWSEALFHLLQYDPSEKIDYDRVNAEIHHPDDLERVTRWLNDCVSSGRMELIPNEYRVLRRDGETLFVRTVGVIEREQGKPVKVFATVQDITERKQAEENWIKFEKELKNRNQFIETILDNLPIGLAVNQINEGKTVYLNKKFEEIYGWPGEELEGVEMFFEKVYPDPIFREGIKNRIIKDIVSGDPERMSWENIEVTGKDGRKRIVTAKNIPLSEQNLMISTVQDVTESVLLQTQLQQAQKMEAVGTLAGGIAHDFNNILTAITGYSELALSTAGQGGVPSEEIRQVIHAADRAKKLVRQILTFSRKASFEPKPININQVVSDAVRILRSSLPKMISIEPHLEQGLSLTNGDPNQIEQVLLNLAGNAQDAMPDGGRLVIETANLSLDQGYAASHPGASPGEYVLITVSDTGMGMDADTLKHIFEPFFTTKEIGKGTGLGLASVYGVVKGHHGHITCSSQPGRGTAFKIYLPVLESAQPPPATREVTSGAVNGGRETVLLVDDEEALREVACRFLQGSGYRVITASSGEEALRLYRRMGEPPDLVILDLGMPGMGGFKAYQAILSLNPSAKVVITSGYSAYGQVKEVLESGRAGFVAKPFRREELLAMVRSVLDGDSPPSAD